MSTTCDVEPSLVEKMKEFRFRKEKTNAALLIKIDKDRLMIEEDEAFDNDISVEDLAEELPDTSPRYVVYSYKYTHKDGRVSYPLIFIYYCPSNVKPEINMLYASSKTHLVQTLQVQGKAFDVRKKSELTEEWLLEKLSYFR